MNHRASAACAVALAALGLAVTARRAERPPAVVTPRAEPAARCAFAPGDERAWTLTHVASTHPGEHRSAATLALRTLSVDAETGATTHLAVLADATSTLDSTRAALAEVGARPFAITLARDCQIVGFGFARGTDPAVAQTVRGLLRPFDVRLAPYAGARSWRAVQRDEFADVQVRYAPVDDRSIARERTRFVAQSREGDDPDHVTLRRLPRIVASRAVFAPAVDGRWLATMSGAETLALDGEVSGTYGSRYELRAAPVGALLAHLEAPAELDWVERALAPRPALAATPETGATTEAAMARLAELYAARRDDVAQEAVDHLTAWLAADPSRASELLALLRGATLPDALRSIVAFVLGRVDDPRAAAALAEALLDPRVPGSDRMRSAVALASSPASSAESLRALAGVARSERDDELRHLALNALGHLRSQTTGALGEQVSAELRRFADEARSGDDRRRVMTAVANAGDPTFSEYARDGLGDADPGVRSAAIDAVAAIDAPERAGALREALARESDDHNLELAAHRVAGLPDGPDDATVALAMQRLPETANAAARVELVQIIGLASRRLPAARAALAAQFRRDPSVEVQVAIGRFLRAEELG